MARRKFLKLIPKDIDSLKAVFAAKGIPTSEIGFYNHPRFIAAEKSNASILELYAAWVRLRARDATYDSHVRFVVPRITDILAAEIRRDGKKGICIDASMMLTKMLEAEGIWCYGAAGSLTIESPKLKESTHFWIADIEKSAGHVWVSAPPIEIVDVALGSQLYASGEEGLVPLSLVVGDPVKTTPQAADFCSTELLLREYAERGPLSKEIHFELIPDLRRVTGFFPSFEVKLDLATLRYAIAGIQLSPAASLNSITSHRWNGKLAGELYDEIIKPALNRSSS